MTIALPAEHAITPNRLSSQRAMWRHVLPFAAGLGLVTFAYVMMSLHVKEALGMTAEQLDQGTITQTISRQWVGGDLGNVLTGTAFFALLWLVPVVLIRAAASSGNAVWCLAMITAGASLLVLAIAAASFGVLYFNTADTSNALSWPSPRSALFALVVLVPAAVTLVARRPAPNQALQRTGGARL